MVRSKQISMAAIQRQKTFPERPRIVAEEKYILMYSYLDKACCKSNGTVSGKGVHKKPLTNPFCFLRNRFAGNCVTIVNISASTGSCVGCHEGRFPTPLR